MDTRLIALGAAALAGLVAGGALWALSGGQAQGEALEALDARLTNLNVRTRARLERPSDALGQALSIPLFVPSTGPTDNPTDVAVQVFGLARSPVRTAALLAVGGAPAQWFSIGETRDGVTLRSVSQNSAVIATLMGEREVTMGGSSQGASVSSSPPDSPPPGFRSPPPPASAPTMSQ